MTGFRFLTILNTDNSIINFTRYYDDSKKIYSKISKNNGCVYIHVLQKTVLPRKFFITSFLAEPGLLFCRGECLYPLFGGVNSEKLAFFCESVMSSVYSLNALR